MKPRSKAPWFVDPGDLIRNPQNHKGPWNCADCGHVDAQSAGWAVCNHPESGQLVTSHVMNKSLPKWCPLIDEIANAISTGYDPLDQCRSCDHTKSSCPKSNKPPSSPCKHWFQDT